MKKHIYDEKNGISYTLQGDYYLPDIALSTATKSLQTYPLSVKQRKCITTILNTTPMLTRKATVNRRLRCLRSSGIATIPTTSIR